MLPCMLRFIIFKLSANKDYYKLLTVCKWNYLHILRTSLPSQSSKRFFSLGILKDSWDDRLWPGSVMHVWREGEVV